MTRKAFTLVEMMTVVALIAIIAAIAVPAYTRMILSAKITEATSFLSLIRAAEQRHLDLFGCYVESVHPTDPLGASGYNPEEATGSEQAWNNIAPWDSTRLNINPGIRSTFFRYKIFASATLPAAGNCGAVIAAATIPDLSCVTSLNLQNNFFNGLAHWSLGVAKADLDKDGTDLVIVFPSTGAAPLVCDQSL